MTLQPPGKRNGKKGYLMHYTKFPACLLALTLAAARRRVMPTIKTPRRVTAKTLLLAN